MDLRSSILRAKGGGVLIGWGVHVVAVLDLVPQIFMDGTGLIPHFDLPKPRHPKKEVLIVDETLILWKALVVVPYLPVHAAEKRPLCELHVDTVWVMGQRAQAFRHQ